MPDALPATAVS